MDQGTNAVSFEASAIFRGLWAGRYTIAFITAMCLFVGGYYAFVGATPLFRAKAIVMLETREETVVNLDDVMGNLSGDASVVASEVEVLRARGLMGKVVDRLELSNDPEFNPTLRLPTFLSQIRKEIEEQLGITVSGSAPLNDEDIRNIAIDILLAQSTVRNIPKSLVFEISVQTTAPKKSARIADTIAELYILNQIEVKFDATAQATSWLTGRVAELEDELEANEARVTQFTAETELVTPAGLAALERQLKDLRDKVDVARAVAEQKRARLNELQNANGLDAQREVAADPELEKVAIRLASVDDKALVNLFQARFARIVANAQDEAQKADIQLGSWQAAKDKVASQIERQSQDLIALQQLTREAEASRLLYEYFLGRLKETSAQQGIQQADSRILSSAVAPRAAASPKRGMILAMSAMFGLVFGAAVVLLSEWRNNTFRTARDLEEATGVTVLGQVPIIPGKNRQRTLAYLNERPTSAAAEAVRNLRTSVLLSNIDKTPKVIVSTSSVPGEGKTTNSLALALNCAGMGKRVLLIEGDIRRRVFSEYFPNEARGGLVSVLAGEVPFEQALHRDQVYGIDLLFGERSMINAADFFSSDAFAGFIDALRDHYDMIVIDTPPVLVVPDARILAQVSDAVLFTVKWDHTTRTQVEDALHMFKSANQKVSGLILSQVHPKGTKRYGYGDSYGAYGEEYYAG